MIKKTHVIAIIVVYLFAFCTSVAADTVVLKSGRVIEGEIVEETDALVAVETERGTEFVSKENIQSINKTRLGVARGTIVELSGDVEVLPKGETQWKPAETGMGLDEGDSVRSGPDSKAVAIFANQLIVAVEQKSNVNLEKLQQSRRAGVNVKVNLDNGQLWNDVGRLKNKRSKFYVETPQAVTGVRGTVFTVLVTPEATTKVGVVSGTVDVRTSGMMITPIKVAESTMTEVTPGEAPAAPQTISADFMAQWNQYKGKFRMLRIGMLGGIIGLSPTQTFIAAAAIGVLIIVVLVVVVIRRRSA